MKKSKRHEAAAPCISRRTFLAGAAGGVSAALLGGRAAAAGPPTHLNRRAHWNVLLLVTSGERSWDLLPPKLALPTRERLFNTSVGFSRFYAASPTSTAARVALFTGHHAPQVGATDDVDNAIARPLMPNLPTLPALLRDAGWFTVFAGRWSLSRCTSSASEHELDRHGFAVYRPPRPVVRDTGIAAAARSVGAGALDAPHDVGAALDSARGNVRSLPAIGTTGGSVARDRMTAASAARWLSTRARTLDQPWFLAVSFEGPIGVAYDHTQGRVVGARPPELGPPDSAVPAHAWSCAVTDALYALESAGKAPSREAFAAECRYALQGSDADLGTVLAALRASGEAASTIVVFTSDRGSLLGAHGYLDDGPFAFEESLRVPLFIDHPDGRGAVSSAALASSVDLAPTLLDLTSVQPDDATKLPGYSFTPSIEDPGAESTRDRRHSGVLFTHSPLSRVDPDLAVRLHTATDLDWFERARLTLALAGSDRRAFYRGCYDGRYKFARYFAPGEHHIPQDLLAMKTHDDLELYDLAEDPGERHNLGRSPNRSRVRLERLNARLSRLIAAEIGRDDGSTMPGPSFLWRL